MSQQSWTWRTWTRRPCALLGCWTQTPSLWRPSPLSPPMSPIRGLYKCNTHNRENLLIHTESELNSQQSCRLRMCCTVADSECCTGKHHKTSRVCFNLPPQGSSSSCCSFSGWWKTTKYSLRFKIARFEMMISEEGRCTTTYTGNLREIRETSIGWI